MALLATGDSLQPGWSLLQHLIEPSGAWHHCSPGRGTTRGTVLTLVCWTSLQPGCKGRVHPLTAAGVMSSVELLYPGTPL
jgi:hypothetical protein